MKNMNSSPSPTARRLQSQHAEEDILTVHLHYHLNGSPQKQKNVRRFVEIDKSNILRLHRQTSLGHITQ